MSETVETAGETASPEVEFTTVDDAADADLAEYLVKAKAEREAAEQDADPDIDDSEEDEDAGEPEPESEELSEETEEAKAPPEKLNSKEKDAEIAKLRADKEAILTKAANERKQRETYIQRLKFQLGETRKVKQEEAQDLAAKYKEQLEIDPAEAIETRLALGAVSRELSEIDSHEAHIDAVHENQSIFEANVDPSEVSIDEIVASFEREGLPADVVNSIKAKPFAAMRAETLVQAHHKVKAQRLLLRTVEFAKGLLAKNQELEKKLGSRPQSVERSLKKVSQAAKQIPQMTGARGGGSSSMDLANIDVDNMTDAELKELDKKLRHSR